MNNHKTVTFTEIKLSDLAALTEVMTRAFDNDAQKYLGVEHDGPPGYDNGDFYRKWLFDYEETQGHKIVLAGKIVGAMIVWTSAKGDYQLGNIFIDPHHQDRGLGTQAWQFVETHYPEARSWTLETPRWAKKNHHFYENKCGFTKIREDGDSFVYHKETVSTATPPRQLQSAA